MSLEHEISDLKDRIASLEADLEKANASGDSAINDLREQLRKAQEELV